MSDMNETTRIRFAEKDFYLEEFRGKSFFFTLQAGALKSRAEVDTLAAVCQDLVTNKTRVVFLIETTDCADSTGEQHLIDMLSLKIAKFVYQSVHKLSPWQDIPQPQPVILSPRREGRERREGEKGGEDNRLLEQLWAVLRTTPVCIGLWPTDWDCRGQNDHPSPENRHNPESVHRPQSQPEQPRPNPALLACTQRLAVRLKVHKLIILDAAGGLTAGKKPLSFMHGEVLNELLREGEAEWTGLGTRRPLLGAIRTALEGGVASVSVCSPSDLDRELFTYAGCGTLFTLTDYCRVEPLGLEDFYDAERLIEDGQQEGYLKPRTLQETSQLIVHGYGAWLGVAAGELAGFCALLPYCDEKTGGKAGEVVGLYTITRFQGEGIGGRLVSRMIQEAKTAGLSYIFACTSQDGAKRLFERFGFQLVDVDAVPGTKWQGYDLARKEQIAVYRRDL